MNMEVNRKHQLVATSSTTEDIYAWARLAAVNILLYYVNNACQSVLADLENWGHFWDAYVKNLWIEYDWWNKILVFQRMNIYS